MNASISASLVKELRERTGVGLMECKAALSQAQGDLEQAIEILRKTGQAKAEKKATRISAEGIIQLAQKDQHVLIAEFNCETDFVGRSEPFVQFTQWVSDMALHHQVSDWSALGALPITYEGNTMTLEETRQALVLKLGENIQLRRLQLITVPEGIHAGAYTHGGRIGAWVILQGGTPELARDLAMHVTALHPEVLQPEDIPEEWIARERDIYRTLAEQSGKPQAVQDKMVDSRLQKWAEEKSLVGQVLVKDNPQSLKIGEILRQRQARVLQFIRYQVGEGIEKKIVNFAEEVMAQTKGQ